MKTSIFSYSKKYRFHMIVGPTFKMVEVVVELLIPILMANIIDIGIPSNDKDYILRIGVMMVALVIFSFFTTTICQKVAAIAAQGFGTELRNTMFNKINSLSAKELDEFSTSSLTTRLTSDIVVLQEAFARVIRIVLRAPFLVIGSIIMAMMIDFKLSLIFLLVTPIITGFVFLILKLTAPIFKIIQKQLDLIALKVKENLFGIRVIKSFNKEDELSAKFDLINQEYNELSKKVYNLGNFLNPGVLLIINIALIAIVYFGGIQVNVGKLTTGHIMAFIEYLTQIQLSIILVVNLSVFFNKAFASKKRVEEVLNTEPSIVFGNLTKIKENKIKLEFKNVDFSFSDSEEKILNSLNFQVKTGEKIGIVGGTGSGKSVLAQLITRLYDTTEGQLLIDGINIKELSQELLSQKVSLVLQKPALFTGTVKSNLLMANQESTDEELFEALRIAQIAPFIESTKEKLDYPIVEGGKNLSGGQKQRISIARGILKNSDILIFDDSFSALDLKTESDLKKELLKKEKDKTILIISQRISSIMFLERIVVLDKGKIVGIGTHQELLESCKLYLEIYDSQIKGEEIL